MTQRKKKRWENQELTAIGRREARTAFYEDSFSRISLNGKWQFLYLDAPELSPAGFEAPGAKEGWDTIDVPSVWQLRGIGPECLSFSGSFGDTGRCIIQMYCICSL